MPATRRRQGAFEQGYLQCSQHSLPHRRNRFLDLGHGVRGCARPGSAALELGSGGDSAFPGAGRRPLRPVALRTPATSTGTARTTSSSGLPTTQTPTSAAGSAESSTRSPRRGPRSGRPNLRFPRLRIRGASTGFGTKVARLGDIGSCRPNGSGGCSAVDPADGIAPKCSSRRPGRTTRGLSSTGAPSMCSMARPAPHSRWSGNRNRPAPDSARRSFQCPHSRHAIASAESARARTLTTTQSRLET